MVVKWLLIPAALAYVGYTYGAEWLIRRQTSPVELAEAVRERVKSLPIPRRSPENPPAPEVDVQMKRS
jgi:hypothetical protein